MVKPWDFCLGNLSFQLSPSGHKTHKTRSDFSETFTFLDEDFEAKRGNSPRATHLFSGKFRTRNKIYWHPPLVPFILLVHPPADTGSVALEQEGSSSTSERVASAALVTC